MQVSVACATIQECHYNALLLISYHTLHLGLLVLQQCEHHVICAGGELQAAPSLRSNNQMGKHAVYARG